MSTQTEITDYTVRQSSIGRRRNYKFLNPTSSSKYQKLDIQIVLQGFRWKPIKPHDPKTHIKRPKSIKIKTLLHYIPNKSVNHIKQSIGIKQITLHTKQITNHTSEYRN